MFSPGRFAGKLAIVTGAGSGIGKATAIRLGREGARVVASDIQAARLESLIAENPDLAIVPVVGDIASQAGVDAVFKAAGGPVDALVSNAGIMDGFLPPEEIDDATFERVMAVNFYSIMRMTRAALPGMLERGKGAIVNVSSEASVKSAAGCAYSASKAAVNSYTKSTALFYKNKGIRANAVAPGGVKTQIEAPFKSELAASVLGPIFQSTATPLAEPEEVAGTITYLLSDDASNVNGAIVMCDGGWSVI